MFNGCPASKTHYVFWGCWRFMFTEQQLKYFYGHFYIFPPRCGCCMTPRQCSQKKLEVGGFIVSGSLCWVWGKYSHLDEQQTACLEVSGSVLNERAKLQAWKDAGMSTKLNTMGCKWGLSGSVRATLTEINSDNYSASFTFKFVIHDFWAVADTE